MGALKPICVPCGLFFKPYKNGVVLEEGRPTGSPGRWVSYKLWLGDLWRCRGCGAQIIVGTGANPIAEHYQPDYDRVRAIEPPLLRVDDC